MDFFKWANLGLLFDYFWSFQTNCTIFTANQCEKWPSSILCRDSKSQPSDYECTPLTTTQLDFFKWANLGLHFVYFRSFQTNCTNFTTNQCEKMAIHYPAPGFKQTSICLQVYYLNHYTSFPAQLDIFLQ